MWFGRDWRFSHNLSTCFQEKIPEIEEPLQNSELSFLHNKGRVDYYHELTGFGIAIFEPIYSMPARKMFQGNPWIGILRFLVLEIFLFVKNLFSYGCIGTLVINSFSD